MSSLMALPDGSAIWRQRDGSLHEVVIERPASFMHGERHFLVRWGQARVWQIAPGSALYPHHGPGSEELHG